MEPIKLSILAPILIIIHSDQLNIFQQRFAFFKPWGNTGKFSLVYNIMNTSLLEIRNNSEILVTGKNLFFVDSHMFWNLVASSLYSSCDGTLLNVSKNVPRYIH